MCNSESSVDGSTMLNSTMLNHRSRLDFDRDQSYERHPRKQFQFTSHRISKAKLSRSVYTYNVRKGINFTCKFGCMVCGVFYISSLVSMISGIDSTLHTAPTFIPEPSGLNHDKQELSNGYCDPLSHQPHQKVETFQNYLFYRNLSEVSTVTGDFDSPLAICKLDMRSASGWMTHFPHVMQHLYACYSYWMENPSKIPVLYPMGIGKSTLAKRNNKYPFLKGFMEILGSQMGLQIMNAMDIEDWLLQHNHTMTIGSAVNGENPSTKVDNRLVPVIPKTVEIHRPLGYVFSHVRELNEMTLRHFDIGNGASDQTKNDRPPGKISNSQLKIGILDRKASSGRSIVNVKNLVQSIQLEIARAKSSKTEMNSNSTFPLFAKASQTVSLEYFEGMGTLEEQIRFFNSVDILVSPHGAQLTGIPFMANKECTQLIEFFPNRYYMPDFYGSLAIDSGIGYSHVYFSDETVEFQSQKYSTAVFQRIVTPNIEKRTQHRAQNLCIETKVVLDTISKAILDWSNCQEQQTTRKDQFIATD